MTTTDLSSDVAVVRAKPPGCDRIGAQGMERPDETNHPPAFAPSPAGATQSPLQRLKGFGERAFLWLTRVYAMAFREMWPLYVWWPAPRWFFGLRLLVRYDHVVEGLTRSNVFAVPFGKEMARLNDGIRANAYTGGTGTPFMLGIDDPVLHARKATFLMPKLGANEIPAVENISFEAAKRRLKKGPATKFEAISGLITAVPIDLCKEYLGLTIQPEQERSFADAAIELSGHLFGKPPVEPPNPPDDKRLDEAGDHVRWFVDRAIRDAKAAGEPGAKPHTLAWKLRDQPHLEARAILMGMIVGFVPTNTLAGGYILDVLLDNRKAMEAAVQAAKSGDDDRLCACLFEALRLKPINLGPFRECKEPYDLDGIRIATGQRIWAMTSSAMCDSRKVPKASAFDPQRPASSYLHFGFGMHWCIGALLARAQITQTFKALLEPAEPRRVTSLECRGSFPTSLTIAIVRKE